ncbi:glycosyltransferase family 52 [Psychromonas arctica]|uniref:Glycosyltransferase family 52 n=1 Tax=Psychromonas arctica TaxID=168275 RepID=A0ABU9HCM8_9GAMM
MNIFLCSTVRHLLFALLKGLSKPEKISYILMITDQQNIDIDSYDLLTLPEHIQVIFIKRSDINKSLLKYKRGRGIKFLSNFNVHTSSTLQNYFKKLLFTKLIPIVNDVTQLDNTNLYLFNDRNKLSRLLRLAFDKYSIIEDGTGNYKGIKFKLLERAINILKGNKQKKRYFGDDCRCECIYLLNPLGGPEYLKDKVTSIDFIQADNVHKYCMPFFKAEGIGCNINYILATQPIGVFADLKLDFKVYNKIIKIFRDNGLKLFIKTHPRESIQEFKNKYIGVDFIESKVPLELVIFSNQTKCHIISLCSSAGLGFENYCERVTLISDDEHENLKKILDTWKNDEAILDKVLNKSFLRLLS